MPGTKDDLFFNKELSISSHPGFMVCFNRGYEDPYLARCHLRWGKFEFSEWCHALDMRRPEGQQECFDKYQVSYWDSEIEVTHWAYIQWPQEFLEE